MPSLRLAFTFFAIFIALTAYLPLSASEEIDVANEGRVGTRLLQEVDDDAHDDHDTEQDEAEGTLSPSHQWIAAFVTGAVYMINSTIGVLLLSYLPRAATGPRAPVDANRGEKVGPKLLRVALITLAVTVMCTDALLHLYPHAIEDLGHSARTPVTVTAAIALLATVACIACSSGEHHHHHHHHTPRRRSNESEIPVASVPLQSAISPHESSNPQSLPHTSPTSAATSPTPEVTAPGAVTAPLSCDGEKDTPRDNEHGDDKFVVAIVERGGASEKSIHYSVRRASAMKNAALSYVGIQPAPLHGQSKRLPTEVMKDELDHAASVPSLSTRRGTLSSTQTPRLSDVQGYGWAVLGGDGFCNFADGLSVGVAWFVGWRVGLTTSLAILLHELPQELSDVAVLQSAGMGKRHILISNTLCSLLSFVGIAIGLGASQSLSHQIDSFTRYVLAMTSGVWLAIGLHLLAPLAIALLKEFFQKEGKGAAAHHNHGEGFPVHHYDEDGKNSSVSYKHESLSHQRYIFSDKTRWGALLLAAAMVILGTASVAAIEIITDAFTGQKHSH